MDGTPKTLEGQQPQHQVDDDLMLLEEEVDQSDNTTRSQDDPMLLDNNFDAQQDKLTPITDFENEIPQYLPEKALLTCSSSLLRADGKQETYLTIHNAPAENYVAQKINDGHEFAIGGDPSHILTSLDREFNFQPQQRWHVIVISEDTLQLTGVSRKSYPLVSGMTDGSFRSEGEGIEAQQNRFDGSMPPNCTTPDQDHPSPSAASSEHNKRKRPHQQAMEQTEEEERQKSEDASIIAADHRFGHYVGTKLCRWCGRRGHEAVQCIKWDPEYFDKLVCIVCNNKKHLLDDCLRFQVMSEEAKVKLVLVDGANRPGARSFFWPWTHFVNNLKDQCTTDILSTATQFPMTRAFIKHLISTERGRNMWSNLWKTFPYGDCEVPGAFHDKMLILDGLDECFDAHWPLMPRAGDRVSVLPAEQQ